MTRFIERNVYSPPCSAPRRDNGILIIINFSFGQLKLTPICCRQRKVTCTTVSHFFVTVNSLWWGQLSCFSFWRRGNRRTDDAFYSPKWKLVSAQHTTLDNAVHYLSSRRARCSHLLAYAHNHAARLTRSCQLHGRWGSAPAISKKALRVGSLMQWDGKVEEGAFGRERY